MGGICSSSSSKPSAATSPTTAAHGGGRRKPGPLVVGSPHRVDSPSPITPRQVAPMTLASPTGTMPVFVQTRPSPPELHGHDGSGGDDVDGTDGGDGARGHHHGGVRGRVGEDGGDHGLSTSPSPLLDSGSRSNAPPRQARWSGSIASGTRLASPAVSSLRHTQLPNVSPREELRGHASAEAGFTLTSLDDVGTPRSRISISRGELTLDPREVSIRGGTPRSNSGGRDIGGGSRGTSRGYSRTSSRHMHRTGTGGSVRSGSGSPSHRHSVGIRWRKGETIGKGAFGAVHLGLNDDTGELMAVKELHFSLDDKKEISSLQSEINLMRSLEHKHIVRYLGTEIRDDKLFIFTEWVSGGSLEKMLSQFKTLAEKVVSKYTKQILVGLAFLHSHDVVHRDIKGANILVDDRGVVKLADFGASKKLSGIGSRTSERTFTSKNQSLRGTPYFMAPEVIQQLGHGPKADIWSVGCTTLQMITGSPPWKSLRLETVGALMLHIVNTRAPPPMPDTMSPKLHDFLLRCFERDPNLRPTATELLQHPFLTDPPARTLSYRRTTSRTQSILSPTSSYGSPDAPSTIGSNSTPGTPMRSMHHRASSDVTPSHGKAVRNSPLQRHHLDLGTDPKHGEQGSIGFETRSPSSSTAAKIGDRAMSDASALDVAVIRGTSSGASREPSRTSSPRSPLSRRESARDASPHTPSAKPSTASAKAPQAGVDTASAPVASTGSGVESSAAPLSLASRDPRDSRTETRSPATPPPVSPKATASSPATSVVPASSSPIPSPPRRPGGPPSALRVDGVTPSRAGRSPPAALTRTGAGTPTPPSGPRPEAPSPRTGRLQGRRRGSSFRVHSPVTTPKEGSTTPGGSNRRKRSFGMNQFSADGLMDIMPSPNTSPPYSPSGLSSHAGTTGSALASPESSNSSGQARPGVASRHKSPTSGPLSAHGLGRRHPPSQPPQERSQAAAATASAASADHDLAGMSAGGEPGSDTPRRPLPPSSPTSSDGSAETDAIVAEALASLDDTGGLLGSPTSRMPSSRPPLPTHAHAHAHALGHLRQPATESRPVQGGCGPSGTSSGAHRQPASSPPQLASQRPALSQSGSDHHRHPHGYLGAAASNRGAGGGGGGGELVRGSSTHTATSETDDFFPTDMELPNSRLSRFGVCTITVSEESTVSSRPSLVYSNSSRSQNTWAPSASTRSIEVHGLTGHQELAGSGVAGDGSRIGGGVGQTDRHWPPTDDTGGPQSGPPGRGAIASSGAFSVSSRSMLPPSISQRSIGVFESDRHLPVGDVGSVATSASALSGVTSGSSFTLGSHATGNSSSLSAVFQESPAVPSNRDLTHSTSSATHTVLDTHLGARAGRAPSSASGYAGGMASEARSPQGSPPVRSPSSASYLADGRLSNAGMYRGSSSHTTATVVNRYGSADPDPSAGIAVFGGTTPAGGIVIADSDPTDSETYPDGPLSDPSRLMHPMSSYVVPEEGEEDLERSGASSRLSR